MNASSRVVRVFLSSTFRDFAEERDLLVRIVFPELRRKCRERQVELVDVDLRWGITEEEAQQGKVLPICLAEIDRSRPYFMGFLGERYGWVPEKDQYALPLLLEQSWLETHRGGKSVTELEILHGVLNNPAMQDRAFFYFRDPAYSISKGGAYLSEGSREKEKLEALKDRLRLSGFPVIENYTSPEELADRVKTDLWRLIDEAFPQNDVPDPLGRERIRHETFTASRLGLYLGGDDYFSAIDSVMTRDAPGCVLVTGDSGSGKSALLANWAAHFSRNHPRAILLAHCLATGADAAHPLHMVVRILREIARLTGEVLSFEGDLRKAFDLLPEWLAKAGAFARQKGGTFLLVLDGLDKMSPSRDTGWWPEILPDGVGVVASCLSGPVRDALELRMPWDILHVSPLRREDCARFITEHLGKYRKSLPHQIIHRILEHPLAGNPLFLRTLLEELRVFGIHEELGGRVSHYLASTAIGDLFERVLERVEGDNARETVRTVLEVLWAARESFAEDELLQVSGLPPAIWSPIHSALDESLIGSGGRIAFSHDYLRQAVEDRYLKTEEDRRRIWRDMARFCAESMRDGRADLSHYVRRNAVRHFLQAEAWDDAVAALSDLEFIGSRAIAQELPEMLSDYSDAAALLPEGEAERARDVSRQNALDRYAREVAEYSAAWSRIRGGGGGAEPQAPRPLECVRLKTHEQTTEEVRRMTEAPDRLDVIRAFRLFVATHVAPLHAYADRPGFVSNLAQNDAPAGPVHEAGVRALARWTGFKLIRQFGPAERYNPVPNCRAILEGHDSPITCMAFSLDGRLIVSGSDDGTVRIWDTHTGQCIRVLDAEQGAVESLALSADGKRLVTLNSLALRVWDTHTGGILHVLENKEQWDDETGEILDFSEWHPGGASCVALSGDGGLIVSGGMTLKMWDGKTLELISTLEGHTDPIHTLCLSGCGNKILSVSSDSIRIWELTREECILCLEGNFNPGTVALGEDGTLVVGDDATLRVLDARTGECLRLLEGHQSGIAAVAMHPNGTLLVSGSYDRTLRAWNPRTGECLRVLEGLGGRIHRLALRADGISVISGGRDGAVWVWDLENSPLNRAFSAHTNRVNSLCLNRDGTRLLSASTDRTVRLWSADCSECLGVFEGHESGVACALFCNNDVRVVSGDSVNSLRIWDSITGECLSVLKGYVDPADESARFVELSAHAAGSRVLTGSLPVGEREVQMNAPREGMVVQIWDLDTGRRLDVFHPRHSWVLSLDQSPNSREILSGGNDGSVRLWDSESGECLRVLAGHREAVGAAKFSPDGARIVSGADDGSLRVWDWPSGDCLLNLGRLNGPIEALDFSADGRLIFSQVSHGILAVWEASYGRCLGVFFLRGLSSVCVDARRGRVFAGFADGALRSYQFQVDTCLGRV